MSTHTPLDSLKDAFWLVRDKIDYSSDHMSGNELLEEGHHVYDILDSAVRAVTVALGAHVPGVTYDLYPRLTNDAWVAARTYDDGTTAIVTVNLADGGVADYRPRLDGDYASWLKLFEPKAAHLTAV